MAISDRIRARATQIQQERMDVQQNPNAPTPVSNEVKSKAVAAVLGGNTNAAWRTYMEVFTSDVAELARLIPTDGTTDAARQEARAYLVSNGVCGIATTGQLLNEVGNKLDI